MSFALSAPALLSAIAGVILLGLVRPARSYRGIPGATGWIGLLVATGVWAVSYGIALTVFDPELRALFEITNYLGMAAAVVSLVAAGLAYTGYDRLVRSPWMLGLVGLAGASWVLIATNALGLHSLVWHSYRIEPVLGAAAVRFEPTVLFYAIAVIAYGAVATTLVLSLETMLQYGSIYRVRALAIFAAGAPVGVANVHWFLNVARPEMALTPLAGLNLTPISFIFMAIVNGYVLSTGDFFDVAPATRRIADRVAFDALPTAVLMVNEDGLVVGMNDTAADLFAVDADDAMGDALQEITGDPIALPLEDPVTMSFPTASDRTHQVSTAPIRDAGGRVLGHTVTIQDVTRQRRRQQRLEVFNRVLRHNLRNDLNVIQGNADMIAKRLDRTGTVSEDPHVRPSEEHDGATAAEERSSETDELSRLTGRILGRSRDLLRTAEKAREVSLARSGGAADRETVDVAAVVERVVEDVGERFPKARMRYTASGEHVARTDPELLSAALENLVENAIVHATRPDPEVRVTVEETTRRDGEPATAIAVADDGPGIPDHELDVISSGSEDQLHHGSGIGLWIVAWTVDALGGQVAFDTGSDGTTATVTIPSLDRDRSPT